jgi:hypothetical protein
MADNGRRAHLILWGETEVGKSTLLVSGLNADAGRLPPIQWRPQEGGDRRADGMRAWVGQQWRRLKLGRQIAQTTEEGNLLELPLGERGENVLRIVDIQGLKSRDAANAIRLIPRDEKAGVLFVCGWASRGTAEYLAAIDGALLYCAGLPTGLALTKCDRALQADDPHWLAPPGWWAEHDAWRPHAPLLERFGDRVWPTSAYGFSEEGRPACLLNEFGELIPYRIAPLNVAAPFVYCIRELGLWPK